MKLYDDQLIVVTGSAGFIGSGVVRHLNDLGMKNIIVVDDIGKTEKWKNLVGKTIVDIIPIQKLFQWLEGREALIEAFIHLGACTDTLETDGCYLLENNYRFSQQLAEYALKNEQRFIYASSAATYGDGSEGFSDDHKYLEKLKPLNMYGLSKNLFDLWLKNQGTLDQVVGLKYFNVFGPNEGHKGRMMSPVPRMMESAKREGVIRLFKSTDAQYGDGEQRRDFIYVKDAVRITCSFLQNEATGIFNVGRGIATTWNEVAAAVFKALKMPVKIEYIPMPADLAGKYQNYTCAETRKLNTVLKPKAQCASLEDSVGDYVNNYLIPSKLW